MHGTSAIGVPSEGPWQVRLAHAQSSELALRATSIVVFRCAEWPGEALALLQACTSDAVPRPSTWWPKLCGARKLRGPVAVVDVGPLCRFTMSDSLHSHGSSTCDSDCCLICQARGKGVKGGDLMSRLWPNERLFGSSGSLAAVPDVISSNKRSPAQSTGAARDVSVPQDCSWFKQAAGKSHSWPQTTEDAGSEGAGLAGSKRTAEAMQKSQSLPQRLSRDGASSSALPSLLVPDNDQPGPCSREDDAQAGAAPRVKRKQPVWDMELSDTDSRYEHGLLSPADACISHAGAQQSCTLLALFANSTNVCCPS